MAITSEKRKTRRYGRSQFRYAITYVVITFIALIFLNIYCAAACKNLMYENKQTFLTDKAQSFSMELEKLDTFTAYTVASTINSSNSTKFSRILVTNTFGTVIYDTQKDSEPTALPEELTKVMNGEDGFSWTYNSNTIIAKNACPIGQKGYIFLMEQDDQQSHLLKTIQTTILSTTIVLELVVIFFSLSFAHTYSKRISNLIVSMRKMQEANFTSKVEVSGDDELSTLAEEFNDLADQLSISERKRRQFVSDASHELKTPLASIKLLAETILQNDMDTETIREFVGDIGDEADRLNRMSQKLLDLTRGDDVQTNSQEIICMAPTIERVCRMLSAQASQSSITIETKLSEDGPILISEDDLYRIIFNLVENGIKYNTTGGTLTISLNRTPEWGIVTVTDTGMGIPEDAIDHIFERFYRVDKARSRASGGSGLGLSIVRNMVLRNQGTIEVNSTFGMGTTFTVKFMSFNTNEEE